MMDHDLMRGLPSRKLAEISVYRRAGQKLEELAGMIDFLRQRELHTVVEIGTDRGGTFWLWCQLAADDATLVSIDMPGGAFGVSYSAEDAETFRTWCRTGQHPYFLRRDSHDPASKRQLEAIIGGSPIDFLFLDGDHTYEGTKQDFGMYAPLVAPGGIIGFHDIIQPLDPEVRSCRFWGEVKQSYEYHEFIDSADDLGWRLDSGLSGPWGGIGLLIVSR